MKNLIAQAFETFGGGGSRQLECQGAEQLSDLCKEELCHVEDEVRNISKPSDFTNIEILACIVDEVTSHTRQDARRVRFSQNDEISHPELADCELRARRFAKAKLADLLNASNQAVSGSQRRWTSMTMRFFGLRPQNDVNYHVDNILGFFKRKALDDLTSYRPNVFKKVAFTLAEVLITLGVIGVVAALTIPPIVKNHEKKLIEVGLETFYAEFQDVLRRSQLDNGPYEYWNYELHPDGFVKNSEAFAEKYLTPYMGLKKCTQKSKEHCFNKKADCCFPVWTVYGRKEYGSGIYGKFRYAPRYSMPNGNSFSLMVTYDAPRGWRYVEFFVDVNGKRGKSELGVDVFTFALFNYDYYGPQKGFHPGRAENSGHKAYTDARLQNYCVPDSEAGQYSCAVILHRNNWKFPKNYPLNCWK